MAASRRRCPSIPPSELGGSIEAAQLTTSGPPPRRIPPSELGGSIEACPIQQLIPLSYSAFRRVNSAAPLKLPLDDRRLGLELVIPPSELGGSIEAVLSSAEARAVASIPPSELGGSIEAAKKKKEERDD